MSIIIANTRYGRYIYAIGSNALGARQSGINTSLYTMMTYMLCSLSAAFGALLFLGRAPYAKSDYGQMWELDAIAAVVIGGTSLFGGRGSLWGTFMGVILLKLINNGLTLAQLDTFWQMVVTGLITFSSWYRFSPPVKKFKKCSKVIGSSKFIYGIFNHDDTCKSLFKSTNLTFRA